MKFNLWLLTDRRFIRKQLTNWGCVIFNWSNVGLLRRSKLLARIFCRLLVRMSLPPTTFQKRTVYYIVYNVFLHMQWPINICKKCVSSSDSVTNSGATVWRLLGVWIHAKGRGITRFMLPWWQSWWIPTTFKRIFLLFSMSLTTSDGTKKWQSQPYSKPTFEVTSLSHSSNCSSSPSSVLCVASVVLHMLIFIVESFISIEIRKEWANFCRRSECVSRNWDDK